MSHASSEALTEGTQYVLPTYLSTKLARLTKVIKTDPCLRDYRSIWYVNHLNRAVPDHMMIFHMTVSLLFDYLITLESEIEMFWGSRFTAASALFFSTRYAALVIRVGRIVALHQLPSSVRT